MTGPVAVYGHGDGSCAIIGGFVYRGSKYAATAHGVYVYGDYCSRKILGTVHKASGGYATARLGSIAGALTGFGLSGSSEIYAVTQDGVLYRATFTKR
jgi:hypothetical protein